MRRSRNMSKDSSTIWTAFPHGTHCNCPVSTQNIFGWLRICQKSFADLLRESSVLPQWSSRLTTLAPRAPDRRERIQAAGKGRAEGKWRFTPGIGLIDQQTTESGIVLEMALRDQ